MIFSADIHSCGMRGLGRVLLRRNERRDASRHLAHRMDQPLGCPLAEMSSVISSRQWIFTVRTDAIHFYYRVFKVCVCLLILSIALWALMIHFAPSPR